MTDQQWNELYTKLYVAYEYAGLKDEYVRSTLGDALDHMILIKNSPSQCITNKIQMTN